MSLDTITPKAVCLALMKFNPHETVVLYRQRLEWAATAFHEADENCAFSLSMILRYDRTFGRCPDTPNTLKTWLATNTQNDQTRARELELYYEDIDHLTDEDIEPDEIPAIEVVLDGFMEEARRVWATITYKKAVQAVAGKVPYGFPKDLAKTLAPIEIATRYVRDRWAAEPRARPVLQGDWVEHIEDASKLLDDHLVTSEQNRVYTGFGNIDSTVVIGKKFLKWIGILGYTNHGKSAFLLPMLYNMARFGHHILLVPCEYSVEETWLRLTWIHSNFSDKPLCSLNTWLRTPKRVTQQDMDTKNYLVQNLKSGIEGSIDVVKLATWDEIEEYVEAHHAKKQYSVVAVDYMGHLQVVGRDLNEARNAMFRRAQLWSQDFNHGEGMVVITPLQANKEGAKQTGKQDGDMCGVYEGVSAVDWFTQAAHDMDLVIGVWHMDDSTLKISCAKSRGQQFPPFLVSIDTEKSRYIRDPYKKYETKPTNVQSKPTESMVDIIDPAFDDGYVN